MFVVGGGGGTGRGGGNIVLIKNIHAKRGCLDEFILRTPRNGSQEIE